MICSHISQILGLTCYPLNDSGTVAMIATSFTFDDGDEVPVYVEKVAGKIRFFDDGGTIMHFMGRGIRFDHGRKTKFIRNIASNNGATLNDDGEIEVWANNSDTGKGFAKYMATLLGLVAWEQDQKGVSQDASLLIEEVALCLLAWKKDSSFTRSPEYKGISGHTYKLDFNLDGEAIVAISPHPQSVSAALKKIVDIISAPPNQGMPVKVVLDDRHAPEAAKNEGLVLGAVSDVLMMSKLEALAGSSAAYN